MKYGFIQVQQGDYPIRMLCRVMQVSTSGYYDWRSRGGELVDSQRWRLCHRMKALFNESRQSLGSRQMMKQLRKEGFEIGRYRVRKLMKNLGLVVKRQKRFVLTTDSKHALPVAKNVLNRDFAPAQKNRVWTTEIVFTQMTKTDVLAARVGRDDITNFDLAIFLWTPGSLSGLPILEIPG